MRWLWMLFGFAFLAVGAVGLFLPLWPTTIFWILAVICLSESHPKVRDWIYQRPGLGPVIEGFVERGELSRTSKLAAIGGMWGAGLLSSWFLRDAVWILIGLWTVLILVALYILSRRTPQH